MIILHGYLLEGSGSNLWTRAIIKAMCKSGKDVHLMCQENHPEIYDFISTVYKYHPNGEIEEALDRETPYEGRCIMHKPVLGDTLPVYVWDSYEEFSNVIPMVDLSDEEVEHYISYNANVLKQVVEKYAIESILANHAVLMSVVAQRVYQETDIDFAIMPHGSALEYAVKRQKRFYDYAQSAFSDAKKIFVIGKEMTHRLNETFGDDIENLNDKLSTLRLGVDISLFDLVDDRRESIALLKNQIEIDHKGKSLEITEAFQSTLHEDLTKEELISLIKEYNRYTPKAIDRDIIEKLEGINWEKDKVLLFVGRFIANKGLHALVTSLPFVLEKEPNTKLIVVGHGPIREVKEVFLWAIKHNKRKLVENIIEWGATLELIGDEEYIEIKDYFQQLKEQNRLDEYFEKANRYLKPENIIFTGYLTHNELQYLFPCCDVAIFPSLIKEAGPLVFLEAMASGSFPMGTYFGGMEVMIDDASQVMSKEEAEYMKLSSDKRYLIDSLEKNLPHAIAISQKYKNELNKIVKDNYDWTIIAKKLLEELG
ncbi:glycosyltransferase family 4 protein [Sulfurovum sp. bin170]|uniref:glycosyltransferase n=1 Tax=Sulfurovum sp. bin170 TaxID=2695268 RepID=UPI0013DEDB1A|nr:glycosyltransferase [Sulfurovum sp. bin170]NEW59874.1 glycosyltransferase family 4 protein [Sulfurovum sp. bin170]